MTFLPIVERELRVASRRRLTWWGRLGAGAIALLIFVLLEWFSTAALGAIPAGQIEFTILKWMTFVFACCAGVFLTVRFYQRGKTGRNAGVVVPD